MATVNRKTVTEHIRLELTHFGNDSFDRGLFQPAVDGHWVKPIGGFWASPRETEFGWELSLIHI